MPRREHDDYPPFFDDYVSRYGFYPGEVQRVPRRPPPPPPPKPPSQEYILSTFSTTFSLEHRYSGLTFADLDGVLRAILIYAGEAPAGYDRITAGMPDLGALLFMVDDATKQASRFVQGICDDVRKWDAERAGKERDPGYVGDWDYDGVGPFLKTNLSVKKVPRGYHLHIYRAYTGNKCEYALSKSCGQPMDFVASILTPTWETPAESSRWLIPAAFFDVISAETGYTSGPELAQAFAATLVDPGDPDSRWEDPKTYVFHVGDLSYALGITGYRTFPRYQIRVAMEGLSPEVVAERYGHHWSLEGVSGPARRHSHEHPDWDDRPGAIGVELWIRPRNVDPSLPRDDGPARAAAERITAHFEGLPRAYPEE